MAATSRINNHAGLIWAIADLLRGDYKRSEYGRVILPLVVLRRLDCVLEPTKDQVLARLAQLKGKLENVGPVLQPITGMAEVYNTSPLTLHKILADPAQVAGNLQAWIAGFDPETREVIEKFDFDAQIGRLDRAKLLYLVLAKVTEVDLHPDSVSNVEMGYLYEELIRRFSELSNETAGEHFTPREVIRLMVDLLFIEDDEALRTPGIVRTMLDPACGTGGMLSVAQDYLRELNPGAVLEAFGQELNPESYAVCRSDMMLKGQKASNIRLGNSFSEDAFAGQRFDYLLANPPFGVAWKKVERVVRDEHERLGFDGRFGAGLPRINDGSFLFLQHMISKLKRPEEGGGRLAIVFNGSPLFSGGPGSGESEIRRWIIENDWLEGIVALPDQLFYNTGISTYFWIVTNRKRPERRGKVVLIDARDFFTKLRHGVGEKRKEIGPEDTTRIVSIYGDALRIADLPLHADHHRIRVAGNGQFSYRAVTVEQPKRRSYSLTPEVLDGVRATRAFAGWSSRNPRRADLLLRVLHGLAGASFRTHAGLVQQLASQPLPATVINTITALASVPDRAGEVVRDSKGRPVADRGLRTTEYLPCHLDLDEFLVRDVHPFAPGAWLADRDGVIGYEINWPRWFRPSALVPSLADLDARHEEIRRRLEELRRAVDEVGEQTAADSTGWPIVALRRVARVVNGGTPKDEPENWGGGIYWATPVDLSASGGYLTETERTLTERGAKSGTRGVPSPSVLISCRAPIGTVAITAIDTTFNQGCKGLVPDARYITAECLAYQLVSLRDELESRGQGTTFMELKAEHLGSVRIVLPPLEYQIAHADAYASALRNFHQIRPLIEEQIDLARKMRRAIEFSTGAWTTRLDGGIHA